MPPEPVVQCRGTLAAHIREILDSSSGSLVHMSRERLQHWLVLAQDIGLTKEQEERARERIAEIMSDSSAKIEALEARNQELREEIKHLEADAKALRLELGRYMDAVDADGDGTTT